MQIIRAGIPHLHLVAPLFDQYRQFYGQPGDLAAASTYLAQRMDRNESVILLAILRDRPVGFTQLYPSFSSVSMKRVWILNDLFVDSSARRLGVAEALMGQARDLAVQTHAKALELATAVSNVAAQRLYERLGYQRDTEFLHYSLTVE